MHLVEVLTLLGLEAILTVEDKLEFGKWTDSFFSEILGGTIFTALDEWDARRESGWHVAVTGEFNERVGFENNVGRRGFAGEVPQRGGRNVWIL